MIPAILCGSECVKPVVLAAALHSPCYPWPHYGSRYVYFRLLSTTPAVGRICVLNSQQCLKRIVANVCNMMLLPCKGTRHNVVLNYRKISNIRRIESPNLKTFLVSSYSCFCPIQWSQALSREWRCSWSSADRRCSNYIWVINKFIAY